MTIEDRVRHLETKYCRVRNASMAFLVILIALLLMGQAQQSEKNSDSIPLLDNLAIQGSLYIVGKDGQRVMELGTNDDNEPFLLMLENLNQRVRLSAEDGGCLILTGGETPISTRSPSVMLTSEKNGSARLMMNFSRVIEGEPYIHLWVQPKDANILYAHGNSSISLPKDLSEWKGPR